MNTRKDTLERIQEKQSRPGYVESKSIKIMKGHTKQIRQASKQSCYKLVDDEMDWYSDIIDMLK